MQVEATWIQFGLWFSLLSTPHNFAGWRRDKVKADFTATEHFKVSQTTFGRTCWNDTYVGLLGREVTVEYSLSQQGQDYFFCNSSLYMITSSLIDLPGHILGPLCPYDFGQTVLSNQWGERGKHFSLSFPEVTLVLHHAKEVTELFYSCGWFNCKYCLHLITLRFNAVSGQYIPQVFYFKCTECQFFNVDFQAHIAKVPDYLFNFSRWSSRLLLEMQRSSSK